MDDAESRLEAIIAECEDLTLPHVFELAREAVQLAESLHDDEYRSTAHFLLLCVATTQGRMREAVVELAWVLQHLDGPFIDEVRDELFQVASHLVGCISAMHWLPRAQIVEVEDRILRHLRDHGVGDKSLFRLRCMNSYRLGAMDEGEVLWRRYIDAEPSGLWARSERDPVSSALWEVGRGWLCMDTDGILEISPHLPRAPRGAAAREAAFSAWTMSSIAAVLGGRRELAMECCTRGLRYFRGLPLYTGIIGEIIATLAALGRLRQALGLVERHVSWTQRHGDGEDLFCFHAGAAIAFAIAAKSGRLVRLRLPRDFALFEASGRYDAGRLSAWFLEQTRAITDAFSRRDGNDYWHRRLDWHLQLVEVS
ncbi:MAG: hypothetical protein M5U25_20500 [Planctomycetota bacterium]|nr:hypothetical protein [Planctomycetota bacterium]